MAYIEKFLGKRVEIPEDRRYVTKPGLWAKLEGTEVVFGLTAPALVLLGGFKELDWLVEEGQSIGKGVCVAFAITGKILYIDSPLAGTIGFNPLVKENPPLALEDSYGNGWLFRIAPEGDVEEALQAFADAEAYIESLQDSEGLKNPEGLKGGVSGICKAVYTGIGGQKL